MTMRSLTPLPSLNPSFAVICACNVDQQHDSVRIKYIEPRCTHLEMTFFTTKVLGCYSIMDYSLLQDVQYYLCPCIIVRLVFGNLSGE